MRSPVKQFESICQDHELKWEGLSHPIVSDLIVKYNALIAALEPFIDAAQYIPEGMSPDEDISCIPRSCFCVGDFYSLLKALKKD